MQPFRRVWPVLLAVSAAGCGTKFPAAADPVPARGKVVLAGGQPARGLRVTFTPLDARGREAFADTAGDGSFVLTTARARDGAVPGPYVVTFERLSPRDRTPVPKKYESVDTSVQVEVKPGQENAFDFRLR